MMTEQRRRQPALPRRAARAGRQHARSPTCSRPKAGGSRTEISSPRSPTTARRSRSRRPKAPTACPSAQILRQVGEDRPRRQRRDAAAAAGRSWSPPVRCRSGGIAAAVLVLAQANRRRDARAGGGRRGQGGAAQRRAAARSRVAAPTARGSSRWSAGRRAATSRCPSLRRTAAAIAVAPGLWLWVLGRATEFERAAVAADRIATANGYLALAVALAVAIAALSLPPGAAPVRRAPRCCRRRRSLTRFGRYAFRTSRRAAAPRPSTDGEARGAPGAGDGPRPLLAGRSDRRGRDGGGVHRGLVRRRGVPPAVRHQAAARGAGRQPHRRRPVHRRGQPGVHAGAPERRAGVRLRRGGAARTSSRRSTSSGATWAASRAACATATSRCCRRTRSSTSRTRC